MASEGTLDAQLAERLIVTEEALSAFLERTCGTAQLALDGEGDGMFRYRGRLCTLQLGVATELSIVDTLAFDAGPLLAPLLGAEGPEKIIHDAAFDARMLKAYGVSLGRVFDTAVAARFLGIAATGLSSLLSARFGIVLEKGHQQADWGKRPLDDAMLRYLADDVRYLPQLAAGLLAEVRAQGIEDEVREECAFALAQAQKPVPDQPAWMRVKGAGQLMPRERAALRALAEVREGLAEQHDLPPGRLINNQLLVHLATRPPADLAALTRALSGRASVHGEALFDALRRAAREADAPGDEVRTLCPPAPSAQELELRKRRRKLLTDFRTRHAQARKVDPQVVLPGHCVSDLAGLDALEIPLLERIPGFGRCRVERYAGALSAELSPRWNG